jgi:xanthine dehydrogenase YagS FAD-binding subunit
LASVALAARVDAGVLSAPRVVLGGVAPGPWRCGSAEKLLAGQRLTPALAARAAELAVEGAEPLAQNGYKLVLARAIVEESLREWI